MRSKEFYIHLYHTKVLDKAGRVGKHYMAKIIKNTGQKIDTERKEAQVLGTGFKAGQTQVVMQQ